MKITKAHKIKLNPTPEQENYMRRAAGTARFAFNWGLAEYNKILDHNRRVKETGQGEKQWVSGRLLKKRFTQERPPWVTEVTTWAVQGAFDDLQRAFSMYWQKYKNGTLSPTKSPRHDGRPNGWPQFKSKRRSTPSFYLANIAMRFNDHFVTFDQKRCGPVNMAEKLRFDGKILAGRVSYRQGSWWLSVQVEMEIDDPQPNGKAVGVDLGIKYLAVTSDGQEYQNPRAFYAAKRKLRKFQRKLDRQRRANNPDNYDEKGIPKRGCEWIVSNKMRETEAKIAKLQARVANIREDASHKLTTDIAQNYGIIGVEDLNIRGMMSNRKLSKAVADAAMYEKRRQLEYKASHNGGIVVPVDQWFASSKTCNGCGWIYADLELSEREWTCQECGQVNERDSNAAKNICDEALRILR